MRLNVPVSAARLVLSRIVPPFLAAFPDVRLEVITEESFVDVLAAGCDAGIRYDDRLEQVRIQSACNKLLRLFESSLPTNRPPAKDDGFGQDAGQCFREPIEAATAIGYGAAAFAEDAGLLNRAFCASLSVA